MVYLITIVTGIWPMIPHFTLMKNKCSLQLFIENNNLKILKSHTVLFYDVIVDKAYLHK